MTVFSFAFLTRGNILMGQARPGCVAGQACGEAACYIRTIGHILGLYTDYRYILRFYRDHREML